MVKKVVKEILVSPKDWMSNPESVNKSWRIYYSYENTMIKIMGMNREKDYHKRVQLTKKLLKEEQVKIFSKGYNPVTKKYPTSSKQASLELADDTLGFIKSLHYASTMLSIAHCTKKNITSCIKYMTEAAEHHSFDKIPVSEIRKKHLKLMMTYLSDKRSWSERSWNAYRSYLMMLFEELDELEMVDHNPAKAIRKKVEPHSFRDTLDDQQRTRLKEHLIKHHPSFYRFVQIFFHSGGRRTEIMKLQIKDVDLINGTYKGWVNKGKKREVKRAIKDVALPFWIEQIKDYSSEYYVFSKKLLPGPEPISPDKVTRRWKTHVKDKLKIYVDLYSLKHLNTEETAAMLSIEDAAAQNAHNSTNITRKHYAKGESQRQLDKLRKVDNDF